MWIRSQDLYTLIKCERLSVRQCGSENYCVIGDERIALGEYSTLEKAFKVLDKIEVLIANQWGLMFDMPADDEVEENDQITKQLSSGGSFALVTFVKGKDKEGNEIDVQKPISYHTTLESALQSYSNNRMADLVSDVDLDLKDVKKAINELKEEIKTYDCK